MSEEKGAVGRVEAKVCGVCHHSEPWHSLVCPKVAGAYCLECQMLLPRHYPWCTAGQRDGWFSWSAPRGIQREVEEHYNRHMRNRLAQRAAGGR